MSRSPIEFPVVYDIDDNGEATTVHFFCCTGCRSQSPYKMPDATNYGSNSDFPDQSQCELCGRTLSDLEEVPHATS